MLPSLFICILVNFAIGLDMRLHEEEIHLGKNKYTRLRMTGEGSSEWVYENGIGYVNIESTDALTITYQNLLRNETIIHAHGLIPDPKYDGVPYVDAKPFSADTSQTYYYGIQNKRDGTYFLHTHYGLQHTRGLAVPIVINKNPPTGYPLDEIIRKSQTVVMFLEDFCDYYPEVGPSQNPKCNNPWSTYQSLKDDWDAKAPTYNFSKCDAPADDTDVEYAYQLANGKTLDDPIVVDVEAGQYIRLRIVNSATMSSYKINLGELTGTIIMTDGQWVVPNMTKQDVFWIAVAQRLDIIIKIPSEDKSNVFPIFAQEIGNGLNASGLNGPYHRSGIVFSTGGARPPAYSPDAKEPTGFMDPLEQEFYLRAWYPLSEKDADVEFDVALTGDSGFHGINKYSWQLPPAVSQYSPNPHPMKVKEGQRVCMNIKNHNADAHSMHLHGHSFQVVEIDGHSISGAMRDTVMTARGQCRTLKICFDAIHPGVWPFHCHMSFHLAAGMFTSVEY